MKGIAAIAAMIVLVLSLAAHVAAAAGIDVEAIVPAVWWLHGATLLVFGAALIVTLGAASRRLRFGEVLALVPPWALAAIALMFVYTVVTLVWLTGATGAGDPIA